MPNDELPTAEELAAWRETLSTPNATLFGIYGGAMTRLLNAAEQLAAVVAERDRLLAAITVHHKQKADDRCWMDDRDLYLAAGLPCHDASIGDPAAMAANCVRFINQRCESGGPWKSYAELESERDRLRDALERIANGCGNHGCKVKSPTGWATNGPCHCGRYSGEIARAALAPAGGEGK